MSLKKILQIQTPHQCSLGIWYDDEGKKRFASTSSYKQIAKPHHIVHDNANINLQYLEHDGAKQTIENANIILKNFERMEEASEQLFELMDKMLEETKEQH